VAAAESADARSDAAAALQQSAAATERIAAAVEILASRQASAQGSLMADRLPGERIPEEPAELQELQELGAQLAALIGPREVRWTVEHRLPVNSYRLRNMGTVGAREVGLLGGTPSADADLGVLPPGAAIPFSVDPEQHSRAVEVNWRDDDQATQKRLALPLPPAPLPPTPVRPTPESPPSG
jgi:hypothetical protein